MFKAKERSGRVERLDHGQGFIEFGGVLIEHRRRECLRTFAGVNNGSRTLCLMRGEDRSVLHYIIGLMREHVIINIRGRIDCELSLG